MARVEKDVEASVQGEELKKDDEVAKQKDLVAYAKAKMENKYEDEKK